MRKVLFMLLLALAVVPAAASAAAARPPVKAQPLPLDQALPLINAPGADVVQVPAQPVTKAEALGAMLNAGASTTLVGGYTTPAAAVAAATGCASYDAHQGWGTFPYDHTIHAVTYFCAVYGDHITSYTTTVTTDQTLCSRSSADHFTYSGGSGYSWVTIQSNATWNCPIIGFIPYSIGGWIRAAYNAWGNAEIVGHS